MLTNNIIWHRYICVRQSLYKKMLLFFYKKKWKSLLIIDCRLTFEVGGFIYKQNI